MRLKEKLKQWLFCEEINDIQSIKEQSEMLFKEIRTANGNAQQAEILHKQSAQLLDECHKFMNSICDVGTDMGFQSTDHSWAVICVHGKIDYVKFVDMSQKDIREIVNFLKCFEDSNRVTDSPLHKGYLEDMIIKKS